ncbi:MAG: hypothetical protein K2N91_05145, partial [Muribaculaceae bacterium]|nr:hypothetical protein [Muribaculaceae bacterium]
YPVIGGPKVFYDEATDTYYNEREITTSVEEIVGDSNEGVIYYNLQGISSDKPFKGLNIIRKADGSTAKMLYR